MNNQTIVREPIEGMDGFRVTRDGRWIGTVFHSNFWGWQWAVVRRFGTPGNWIGGQCSDQESGFTNVMRQVASDEQITAQAA